ncbi:hypothetical protein EXN66_Car002629 [Channa argus]|uniref:Uncharacterized protein n=1 Tax=Channa argus TaxID=215402 RepID=A0A6G1P9N6_CHAAH|nr:hypothetical protein EXN66_Car002629 [Channa argus]
MFCTYIVLFYLLVLKVLYTASYSPIHTHTHTNGGAAMQLANTHQSGFSVSRTL